MSGCRIVFDRTKCAGIGLCEMKAPDFFEIADDGDGRMTLKADIVDESRRAEVEEAVSSCPTASLSLVDL